MTFPLLANVYLISTLLASLWTAGDFTTAYFVSSGAPALQTDMLATFGFRAAFDHGDPALWNLDQWGDDVKAGIAAQGRMANGLNFDPPRRFDTERTARSASRRVPKVTVST